MTNNLEQWKPVVGFEGIYDVSNTGKVRSVDGKSTQSTWSGERHWHTRILKQKVSKDHCCKVSLYKDKINYTLLVHRLVAYSFIPEVDGYLYINHLDGNRLNNNVENLEWCNHLINNNHAFDNGLMTSNTCVILENIDTKELKRFRSMSKASLFMGHCEAYLSLRISKGKYESGDYKIYISKGGTGRQCEGQNTV